MSQTPEGGAIAVFGAGGPLGRETALALLRQGRPVRAVTRARAKAENLAALGAEVVEADLSSTGDVLAALSGCACAIFTPDIRLSVAALPQLAQAGLRQAVFVSSHNVDVAGDDPVYAALAAAEAAILASPLKVAVVRPTIIYGDPALDGMTRLMRLARLLPVMPTPGPGKALQQPVHVEDLARVLAWLATTGERSGRVLAVGGPEVVSLRALYAAASRATGRTGWTVSAPTSILRVLADVLGPRAPLSKAQLARVARDKAVTIDPALPREAAPRIGLEEGLARLARLLR